MVLVAAADYKDMTGNEVYLCRFVINPHVPHVGALPGRKVHDFNSSINFVRCKQDYYLKSGRM